MTVREEAATSSLRLQGLAGDALRERRILIVDDRSSNVSMLERLLSSAGYTRLHSTTDPAGVLMLCRQLRPDLVLLDLHMPGLDGFELMAQLDEEIRSAELRVLVMAPSPSIYERRRALALGARDFLAKPLDRVEVLLRVRNVLETRYLQLQLQNENERLADRVSRRTAELEQARRELLDRLAVVAEYRDYATAEHTRRVGRTAGLLAQVVGLAAATAEMLSDAAPLHDIGKLAVSDAVLLKPGPLDDDEVEVMRTHVEIGAQMLGDSRAPVLRMAEDIALYHHERWDGSGYASGRAGDEIPLAGRITAIADVFDALTHRRPYKPALPVHYAVHEIRRLAGAQFDPELVEAFCELDHGALV